MREIKKKKMMLNGWVQMAQLIVNAKDGTEESLQGLSGDLFNYKLDEDTPRELNDSEESYKMRRAATQLRNLEDEDPRYNQRHVEAKRKVRAANKLLVEKEKAIRQGLQDKLAEFEEDNADAMLEEALKIDVQKEIEARY